MNVSHVTCIYTEKDLSWEAVISNYRLAYRELTGSKNENIHVILSEIQEIDQNVHQVPQDLPQSSCFRDIRRHDGIKSVRSKTGKIIIKLYISETY